MPETVYNAWMHRFAKLLAAATFVLIFIGGLVTSTGSGLSVPDWPTTYGHFMFSFPFSKMVGGILYEHGHRMVATVVGMLTVVLAVWLWVREPRSWVRWFGVAALFAVIAQGILGGVTVLFLLPTPISVLHACIAQAFFCMTICLAMFTSREWVDAAPATQADVATPSTQHLTAATTALVYIQLILGAVMRHTGSGLAIPDFPLAFGRIIPPIESQQVAIHFLHRVGALLVSVAIVWTTARVLRRHSHEARLVRPALVLLVALVLQIFLAGLTIWTRKAVLPTTAHVATGAFILGTSLFLTLRTHLLMHPGEQKIKEPYAVKRATT
ncbi:MAG: heme A synthase [Calditrichaeota bacterium]|nr:MAG: heme A synthase [Calditrichota bacterium]